MGLEKAFTTLASRVKESSKGWYLSHEDWLSNEAIGNPACSELFAFQPSERQWRPAIPINQLQSKLLAETQIVPEPSLVPPLPITTWLLSSPVQNGTEDLSVELSQAIDESRYIYELEDDWDDEGSSGYTEEFWSQAISFLKNNAQQLRAKNGVWVYAPTISPGPYGSIDLHWETSERELLIKIPANLDEPASYYGDDRRKNKIKGTLDISENNEWILLWLMS